MGIFPFRDDSQTHGASLYWWVRIVPKGGYEEPSLVRNRSCLGADTPDPLVSQSQSWVSKNQPKEASRTVSGGIARAGPDGQHSGR